MRIASFNINGIKARLPALLDWLAEAAPDVVTLQEIKSTDETFPRDEIESAGWNVETHGQKGFNGVAIVSKRPVEDVVRGLPGADDDEQARWIEATVMGERDAVRLCGLYLPNGNPVPGPKYDYKLSWMARLEARVRDLLADEMPAVVAGDYNVIPQDGDAARPEAWRADALALPQTREAYRRILNLGLTDALGVDGQRGRFTFWDYQANSWEKNDGIRIDHLLLTPQAADLMTDAGIDQDVRGRVKPSDHVPVWVELDV